MSCKTYIGNASRVQLFDSSLVCLRRPLLSQESLLGDVLAGYFAKCMGFPIEKLVIATNENVRNFQTHFLKRTLLPIPQDMSLKRKVLCVMSLLYGDVLQCCYLSRSDS